MLSSENLSPEVHHTDLHTRVLPLIPPVVEPPTHSPTRPSAVLETGVLALFGGADSLTITLSDKV